MILDTLVHSFACSTSILLLSLHLSRVRAQPLPSSFIGSTRLRLLDRWSKVIFRPKHDASPGPGSQSVTEGKIILRPLQTIARAPLLNARSYQTQSTGLLLSCTTSLHHTRFWSQDYIATARSFHRAHYSARSPLTLIHKQN